MGDSKFFSLSVYPHLKKKYAASEVLIPIGCCDFIPAWQNMKYKKACITLASKVSYLLVKTSSGPLKTKMKEKSLIYVLN